MSGNVLPLSTEVKLGWGVDSVPMLEAGGTREVVASEGIAGNGDGVPVVFFVSDRERSVGGALVGGADCRLQKEE